MHHSWGRYCRALSKYGWNDSVVNLPEFHKIVDSPLHPGLGGFLESATGGIPMHRCIPSIIRSLHLPEIVHKYHLNAGNHHLDLIFDVTTHSSHPWVKDPEMMKEYTSYNYLHADLTTPIFYYLFALGWRSQKPLLFELNIIGLVFTTLHFYAFMLTMISKNSFYDFSSRWLLTLPPLATLWLEFMEGPGLMYLKF